MNPNTDNGNLEIRNRTDYEIIVHYDQDTVYGIEERHKIIAAHKSATIFVDTHLWDGDITVEMSGTFTTYDLDFSVLGFETLDVYEEDFPLSTPTADG